jgi:hypothetical protein
MAGITCTGCGAHVTVRGLTKCPICRIPMKPVLDSRIKTAAPSKSPVTTSPSPKGWLAIIAFSVIAILIGLIGYRVAVPSESKLNDEAVSAALYQCQRAIQLTAQYGDSELPPYVKNYGTKGEFYFAWPRGSFKFSNGFGAKMPMSASCIGSLVTGEIKSLTINAKDVL